MSCLAAAFRSLPLGFFPGFPVISRHQQEKNLPEVFSMRDFALRTGWLLIAAAMIASAQAPPGPTSVSNAKETLEPVELPDGLPVVLRFAQPLWNPEANYRLRPNPAKAGDPVHLVVAQDVVLNNRVIIRKGAPAHATVARVTLPSRTPQGLELPCTCIYFRLESVQAIDGEEIPLRGFEKGKNRDAGDPKPKSFTVEVFPTKTGSEAKVLELGKSLRKTILVVPVYRDLLRERTWIPPGTRLTTYVNGKHSLNKFDVEDALEQLPLANESSVVMIYRTKGQNDARVNVLCDEQTREPLGSLQFVAFELPGGTHSCKVEGEPELAFSTENGHEYYFRLGYSMLTSKWKIASVDQLEGEDGVEEASPAGAAAPEKKKKGHGKGKIADADQPELAKSAN
jgi:hypothetical protein